MHTVNLQDCDSSDVSVGFWHKESDPHDVALSQLQESDNNGFASVSCAVPPEPVRLDRQTSISPSAMGQRLLGARRLFMLASS